MKKHISVRNAYKSDIPAIQELLAYYASDGIVLPRSEQDILDYLPNFVVAEHVDKLVGCAAVRDFGNALFEVRSLALKEEYIGLGLGREMMEEIIIRLRHEKAPCRLFALTYQAPFFRKLGFHDVEKEIFPEKIWSDCVNCPKKDHCDEDALLIELEPENS
jgi:amino-acid N-acetyltransferase